MRDIDKIKTTSWRRQRAASLTPLWQKDRHHVLKKVWAINCAPKAVMASCPLRRTKVPSAAGARARAPPRAPARPGSERRVRTATRSLRFVGSRVYVFSLNRTGRLDGHDLGHEGKYLGLISAATTRGGAPARALGLPAPPRCATLLPDLWFETREFTVTGPCIIRIRI